MNLTTRKLIAMLTENTGRAMGDSGDAYGRHHERNQTRNFEAEQPARIEAWLSEGGEFRPDVTLSTFHFLKDRLTYSPTMNRRYQAFARKRRETEYELAIMDTFAKDYLGASGIYGEGEPGIINTYNGECLLDQTLQYCYFEHDGDAYILLQIHGGCDVRGGYTDAVAFEVTDGVPYLNVANATIYDSANNWTTDDAWHWYEDGGTAGRNLETYPMTGDPAKRGDGQHTYIDDDRQPYSPLTGEPLQVSPY